MKRLFIAVSVILVCIYTAPGGEGVRESLCKGSRAAARRAFTGSPATDFFSTATLQLSSGSAVFQEPNNVEDRKSPVLAAVLSAAVPGAGEFYSQSYIKSGAFLAAEVISWIVNVSYNRKGDRATTDFQNYADANWSVVRYAEYLNKNEGGNIGISPNENLPVWQRVNWAEINDFERKLGGFFSHTLPPHGDQQYYELIGKYPQYNPGWDDGGGPISETNISPHFKGYSIMRGDANDLYNTASAALVVVVANHILSAADAAWSAARYNNVHTALEMKMQRTPLGFELVPTATVSVRW
ncbi:MAG: hypothetical protein WBW16_05695 [Bacteroidota bacterium]